MTNINTANIAVKTIEDFQTVCDLCRDTSEPVQITYKEHDNMVIMSEDEFEEMQFRLFQAELEKKVAHSLQQAERGEVSSALDFFDEMQKRYGYEI